jgi:peroxiredoxin (alkyl hydroperoxide reductase subunit C)
MSGMVAAGTSAPDFTLTGEQGEAVTRETIAGQTSVFVFYPFAFSPVCTDQFQVYDEVLDEFEAEGAKLYGVSCDAMWSQKAFKEKLGIAIPQLSDFEPKGATSRAFGVYVDRGGFSNRAIVVIGPDGTVVGSHLADNPGVLPGANVIFDLLAAANA